MAKRVTAQGIFNHVYRFIVRQGRCASDVAGVCQYRATHNGKLLCCAAGCLLSDAEAAQAQTLIESGWKVSPLWHGVAHLFPRFNEHHDQIRALQKAHDHASAGAFGEWARNAKLVAEEYGLTVPADV